MATITTRLGAFTGHVGPVRFRKGVATTEDADLVDFFRLRPDEYDVDDDTEPDPHFLGGLLDDQRETWDQRHGDETDTDGE